MKHLDLFSGIGGFSLALDTVFNEQPNEHTFIEWDGFCTEVLKKHWPESEYHKDIRAFIADTEHTRLTRPEDVGTDCGAQPKSKTRAELPQPESTRASLLWTQENRRDTIVTGGFPCQPFSQAGRRQGTSDDRYLWPEMFRVIQLYQPTWVIAENVGGLVTWNDGMVLEQVCTDLESENYEVQPLIIPAVAVNAPHRRDRVWIVGYSKSTGRTCGTLGQREAQHGGTSPRSPEWERNWTEVATRLCRVDDGVPKRLDRTPRLKALGNAIVPQVAEEIMRAIKQTDYLAITK